MDAATTELVAALLRVIVAWSGQPWPAHIPPVEIVPSASMPCNCQGFFAYARESRGYGGVTRIPERLLLRDDVNLATALGRSILLHELVHALQAQSGPAEYGTPLWYRRERQAYAFQARYLRDADATIRLTIRETEND
ncbi:MAG: hypothetical protein K2Y35_20885 [Burkholderiales bacterium]|nr:hypothetical protein [Burkholderiales bacterium]